MTAKTQELQKRVEELERRVRDLEARPIYVPYYPAPTCPQYPPQYPWVTTCGTSVTMTVSPNTSSTVWVKSADNPTGFATSGYAQVLG